MDIKEFFEQSAGRWFSQRTSNHITSQPIKNGKSNITMEMLSGDAPEVIKLCKQYQIEPGMAIFGLKVIWDGTVVGEQKKQTGSTVVVAVPNPENPEIGKLLRTNGDVEETSFLDAIASGGNQRQSLMGGTPKTALPPQDRTGSRSWGGPPRPRYLAASLKCRYSIGQDDVLTMITEGKTLYAEERFWFASPNFRLRTNVLQQRGQLTMASLATEIRLGVT
ncbi:MULTISPECIES: phycobiliprotein lyase [unclassified Moorena]|uniref:phycobiliprotein lyase n=3 Tax=Coleofasciculaceae TaxID=1892251 RepID=UPI001400AF59|nr:MULTISPECIES: phycobiliprotein lyase [unclassified Moorena]NEO13711.1 phycobiliprotein lyase [Moorena sp. SIO3E8]NEO49353.1 phycobiliprotein lyase [Moorena sp. SIO4A3]NEP98377.1 phycobiliprotein lyase [Moorena sp. SIO3F7]